MYVTFEQAVRADYVAVCAVPNEIQLGRIRGRAFTPEQFTVLTLGELREIIEYMEHSQKPTVGPSECQIEVTTEV